MNVTRRNFLKLGLGVGMGLGLGAGLLSFAEVGARAGLVSREMYVFGTVIHLGAEGPEARVNAALDEIEHEFLRMNRDWHAWKPGELSRLNAALAEGRAMPLSVDLEALLRGAREAAMASGGLFNPALGHLIALWDFQSDLQRRDAPPSADEVEAVCARAPSLSDLAFGAQGVGSGNPHVRIDLGGYAKGEALNRALGDLAARGLGNAVVNLGGNLAVSGLRDGRPWRIGVRHPQGEGVIAALDAEGREAIVTSGTYERYREWGGRRYPHILDPRSGWPAEHVVSATIVHPDGAWADAAATALVVAGAEDWPVVAARMGIAQAMVIDDTGVVSMTPAIAPRIRFVGQPPARVRVV
ncbi:MAG: FAD:protein FMN transferase [Pseudomonadota bacterium]